MWIASIVGEDALEPIGLDNSLTTKHRYVLGNWQSSDHWNQHNSLLNINILRQIDCLFSTNYIIRHIVYLIHKFCQLMPR